MLKRSSNGTISVHFKYVFSFRLRLKSSIRFVETQEKSKKNATIFFYIKRANITQVRRYASEKLYKMERKIMSRVKSIFLSMEKNSYKEEKSGWITSYTDIGCVGKYSLFVQWRSRKHHTNFTTCDLCMRQTSAQEEIK